MEYSKSMYIKQFLVPKEARKELDTDSTAEYCIANKITIPEFHMQQGEANFDGYTFISFDAVCKLFNADPEEVLAMCNDWTLCATEIEGEFLITMDSVNLLTCYVELLDNAE